MQYDIEVYGKQLEDVAQELSHRTDLEGMSGASYSMAIGILADTWKYGEQLRVWQNKKYGIDASEKGTVNSAVLKFKQ